MFSLKLDSLSSGPSHIAAEQKLLGAILINQIHLERVESFLKIEHFDIALHQEIYKALLKLNEDNIMITPVVVRNLLENNEDFQRLDGRKYIANLTTLAITVIDVLDYGRIIYDAAIKRQIIRISEEAIKGASNSSMLDDAVRQVESIENKLYNLTSQKTIKQDFLSFEYIASEALEHINKAIKNPCEVVGISSGFTDLDNKLGGFHNSDLIVLAGRPGMGKTALALNFAVNAAKKLKFNESELSVGFFSLEMSSIDLMRRVISMETNIDSSCFLTGKIDESGYNEIRKAIGEIKALPLHIDDSAALTINSIRNRAKRLKRQHNLGLLLIDYLQLIKCVEKMDNRTLEVSEISRCLKALAKELDIPIVALSQLSRAVEQRSDKRPMLSDLRESGAIEQDADIVMFIYREEYYLQGNAPKHMEEGYQEWVTELSKAYNVAEILIAKHRKGPLCNIKLYCNNKYSKFSNILNR